MFWIVFCFLFQSFDYFIGVYVIFVMVLVFIIGFIVGNIFLNRKYWVVCDVGLVEKIIVEEFDCCRKDVLIYQYLLEIQLCVKFNMFYCLKFCWVCI